MREILAEILANRRAEVAEAGRGEGHEEQERQKKRTREKGQGTGVCNDFERAAEFTYGHAGVESALDEHS